MKARFEFQCVALKKLNVSLFPQMWETYVILNHWLNQLWQYDGILAFSYWRCYKLKVAFTPSMSSLVYEITQNKTTHRLWMLQSKQYNMPRNLFRSTEKTADFWSRRGSFNLHWNCSIFHCQHNFLPNRRTNEEQLKSKPSNRRWRWHTMKFFFLHKTPEWLQQKPQQGNRDKPALVPVSGGFWWVLILYRKNAIYSIFAHYSNSWKQILFGNLYQE